MKKMKNLLPIFLCLNLFLGLAQSHSEDSPPPDRPNALEKGKTFIYKGVENEVKYQLQNKIVETRYRTETVPDTCTREVPYTENVCEQVTRHREECNTIPGEEVCRDVPDRECHDETSTREVCRNTPGREVCHPGPDRRVCHSTPGREECRPGRSRRQCRTTADREQCRPGRSERVCEDGPSRRECSTSPGREVCENKPGQRVCRTRNGREVCHDRPGRRVCRKEPGERTCRTVPGERQCRNIPGDPICRTIPGRETCTDVPGEPICRSIPGERQCRNVPGNPVCRSIPGERICRDVSETNTVCRDITRNVCEWVPEHQQCHQVPYEETVCNDVVRYRTEEYACTTDIQVPYDVVTDVFNANILFDFTNRIENPEVEFTTLLNKEGKVILGAKNISQEKVLILAKRNIQELPNPETEETEGTDSVALTEQPEEEQTPPRQTFSKWSYKILLGDPDKILAPINKEIASLLLKKGLFAFETGVISHPKYFTFSVKIVRKGKTLLERDFTAEELEIVDAEESSVVKVDLAALNVKIKKKKKYTVAITIKAALPGKVLNADMPKLSLEHTAKVKASK